MISHSSSARARSISSIGRARDQVASLVRHYEPRVVVIDCSAVALFEYTAIRHFRDFDDKLKEAGVELWIADLNPEALKVVDPSSFGQSLGHERMFFNLEQAVETYLSTH